MPCDSVITNTVDMPKMDPRLVGKTIESLKNARNIQVSADGTYATFTVSGNRYVLSGGQLTSSNASEAATAKMATTIKNAYGHQVVRATARKNGWDLRQMGPNNYVAVKR